MVHAIRLPQAIESQMKKSYKLQASRCKQIQNA
jgi:hypothetical protein